MGKNGIRSLLSMVFVVGVSGSAAAAEVQRTTFGGSGVSVNFFGSAAITCDDDSPGFISAFGVLLGAEQIQTSTGSPDFKSNAVFVQIDSYSNSCTGQIVGNANNTITNGFVPPDKKLNSSTMAGSTVVTDFISGQQLSVSIDVDLFGEGQLQVSKSRSRSSVRGVPGGPVTITMSRSANTNRSGAGDGTISINGVDIAPEFFSAFLFGNSNAIRTVSR
jgi:hypothetical protein